MTRTPSSPIARGLLVLFAAALALGSWCDPKEEEFFSLIDDSLIPGQGDIFGNVEVDGSPRSGVTVSLRNAAGQVIATDVTDQSGNYGFINVDPGSYTVSIAPPSGTTCDPSQKPATVTANQETTVNFDCATPQPTTGALTVNVTSGTPATALSGATVQITGPGGTFQATTNASGAASFTNLTPGTYSVTTTATGLNCASASGNVVAGQTGTAAVHCTAPMATVPTTAQIQGGWNYTRTRTSTTGNCTPALANTGTGSMTATSSTSLGVTGLDPDVNLSGTYNPSNGSFTGTGSTTLQNGFTIMTNLNATFSFDGSQNPRYVDIMIRIHTFGGNTICTENYMTTGSRATASSARFKRGVTALLPDGATLFGLRPVSFRYRPAYGDPRAPQIGLLAEEVARIYPAAVARDAAGRPEGIWYGRLTGLVLERTVEEAGSRAARMRDAAAARLGAVF